MLYRRLRRREALVLPLYLLKKAGALHLFYPFVYSPVTMYDTFVLRPKLPIVFVFSVLDILMKTFPLVLYILHVNNLANLIL